MKKLFCFCVLVAMTCTSLTAQQDEMQLMDDVVRLQSELKSSQIPERDAAEKELLELGLKVLDHLEMPEASDSSDYRTRVQRVRSSLEKIAVKQVTQSSKIKLDGSAITVQNLLKQIKEQTGNEVILGREVTMNTAEKEITINGTELEFWDLLNRLMDKAQLRIDPYDGEQGQLALAEKPPLDVDAPALDLTNYSNVMRFQVTRIDAARNFQNANLNFNSISLQLKWEPRIQPIAIDFPLSSITMVDEFDQEYSPNNPEAIYSGIVQPEIPQLEFTVNTPLFERQIEVLKEIRGQVEAVLPGRIETFKFKNISSLENPTEQTKAGATVAFRGIEKNEDLWGVRVQLSFDEDNNALESHQGWAFNNELYLVDAEGNRREPIGYETYQQTNEMIGIQYFFDEDPGELDLHYRTPAAVVKVSIPFVIKGIPLP